MTIFLAGAHGVGKTYLAHRTALRLGVQHVTASELIKEERGRATWTHDRRVHQVAENQEALIAAVARRGSACQPLLLDGHFVLRGSAGQLVELGLDVFARLHVAAVVLIEAPDEIVAERLASRGGPCAELSSIRALATAERAHARRVCSLLGLPLVSLDSPSEEQFAQTVERLLGARRK